MQYYKPLAKSTLYGNYKKNFCTSDWENTVWMLV